ncbi:insulinase family protein [candidate division WOR-3 bacterium]|uniref:Insulinase family protein n=1 Tax=candidate division WOR-3 bacterium TaxID=2052148 RepID=A0A9D5K9Y4_UNCW3|nr:insulinase family protein [candidate division WOR-3 bacterium]MBD3365116.1 insulinase family protein [candidate division WOR-3 bacterium]
MNKIIKGILLTAVLVLPVGADVSSEMVNRVVEHELENGMRFLIFERHDAPLVSMVIAVRAGSVNEVTNKTGLAHFLEHLAFKGTETIGTTNYRKERKKLEDLDAAFQAYYNAVESGAGDSTVRVLHDEFKEKQAVASEYVVQGEFSNIYERNGGVGLNASTSYDYTRYYITLPSNRFELWCAMESDRLTNPVFRELYSERDVILEERRMRTDNSPAGLFYEEFNSVSYKAHPYGEPIIGHFSDMKNLARSDVRDFYRTYYVPQNITAAIVGDVEAEKIIPVIDEYFSPIPAKPEPPELITVEPPQPGIRRVKMDIGRRPMLYMLFPTVPEGHPDEIALDLLASVIGQGQTSRLYRKLVEDEKLATYIYASHGTRLYSGFLFFGAGPTEQTTPEELEQAILDELQTLPENPITRTELDAALARWEVSLYDYISSNYYMAYLLATSDQGNEGWQYIFTSIREAKKITPEEVMETADKYINPDTRSVGIMEVEND